LKVPNCRKKDINAFAVEFITALLAEEPHDECVFSDPKVPMVSPSHGIIGGHKNISVDPCRNAHDRDDSTSFLKVLAHWRESADCVAIQIVFL
jgi:hypothetical protein